MGERKARRCLGFTLAGERRVALCSCGAQSKGRSVCSSRQQLWLLGYVAGRAAVQGLTLGEACIETFEASRLV